MATVPLHILLGDFTGANGGSETTFDTAVTADNPPAATSLLCSPYFAFVTGNPAYDFSLRSFGGDTGTVPVKHNDPVDPKGNGWHPQWWNHDRNYDLIPSVITAITPGATVTTLTLSQPHGFPAGTSAEILVENVGGADADQINKTWIASFVGTNQAEITLASSGLTLTTPGTARVPLWFPFGDTIAGLFMKGVTNTDRSVGGSKRENSYDTGPESLHGYEVSYMAAAHDYHAPRGERAHGFQHAWLTGLSARAPVAISAGTLADPAVITATGHGGPLDVGRQIIVTVYGLTGDWSAANGVRVAEVIDEDTLRLVGVDSSGWAALPGSGFVLAEQRMGPAYGEGFLDLTGRLNDAKNALTQIGDTAEVRGVVASYGRREAAICGAELARLAPVTPSNVTTGFPTRITFPIPLNLPTVAAGRALLQAKITAAGSGAGSEILGRWEFVVVDASTIDVLAPTTASITASDLRIDVGDASRFFLEDLTAFVTGLRAHLATEFSQEATSIPLVPVVPRYREEDHRDGTAKYQISDVVTSTVRQSILRMTDRAARIGAVSTGELEVRSRSSSRIARDSILGLGESLWAEVQALGEEAAIEDRGVPCIAIIGDSICNGTANYLSAAISGDATYNGNHDPASRNAVIFDQRTDTNEPYRAVDQITVPGVPLPGNDNTNQVYDGSAAVGPTISLVVERAKAYSGTTVYVLKFGVAGSGLTDIFLPRTIDGITVNGSTVTITVPGIPGSGNYGTGRPIPGSQFTVELSEMTGNGITGLPAGRYVATVVDFRTVTIEQAGVGGTYTAGGTIGIPQPDWRKASGDLWPLFEDLVRRWFLSIEAEGKYPDLRECFVFLGTNDALFGDPSAFLGEAQQFAQDVRGLISTRSRPRDELAIAWQRTRSLPVSATVSAQQVENIGLVQTAQDSLAASDERLGLIDLDSIDESDLELTTVPINQDGIHTTFPGEIRTGIRANNAIEAIGLPTTANPGSLNSPEVTP